MIFVLSFFFIVFIVYLVHTYYYSRHWSRDFDLIIDFSEEQAGEGDELFLYETAINNKKMRLPSICVKFGTARELCFSDAESGTVSDHFYRNDVMSVDRFQKVRRKLRFQCKRRGIYQIREAEIVSYDLFYKRTFVHKLEVSATLCVYPSLIDADRLMPVFRELNGGAATRVPLYEDPYAYAGVRELTPQDSMRRIHWKASARTGAWQVKTTEYIASSPVEIILNLESPGVFTDTDLMEESIRIAYSLVYYLGRYEIETTLVVNGDDKLVLSGNGRAYMTRVRQALAGLEYHHVETKGELLLEQEEAGVMPGTRIIIVSPAGKKPMQERAASWIERGILTTWVAPLVSTNGADSEFREIVPGLQGHIVKWGGI